MNVRLSLLLGAVCLASLQGYAQTIDYGEALENLAPSRVLENADGSRPHWSGIGRIKTPFNCTASLLDTRAPGGSAQSPAYVLTAGHCIELGNGNVVIGRPITGSMSFNYFTDTTAKTYPLKTVSWRSMQGVDLAIVELDVSLQQLIGDGIQPLKLAATTPTYGSDILIVGAPAGFDVETLRLAACTLQPAKDVIEGRWVWRNTFMNTCRDIRGGSSGSPVIDRHTNEIIGVIGSGGLDKDIVPCGDHAVCSPEEPPPNASAESVFGNPTDFITGCFNEGRIASDPGSSCQLFPGFTVTADEGTPKRYQRNARAADGSQTPATWNYRFSINTPFYRNKTVRKARDCESPHHYHQAMNATNAFIDEEIGQEPGYYFLCILGVETEEQSANRGLLKNALSLPVEILDHQPTPKAKLELTPFITVELDSTEEPLRSYAMKYGAVESTDCDAPEGYKIKGRQDFILAPGEKSGKLCTIAYDRAGQASAVRVDLIHPARIVSQ